eukprot:gene22449-27091_t
MDDAGTEKSDLQLPKDDELRAQMEQMFEDGKDCVVTVLAVSSSEAIVRVCRCFPSMRLLLDSYLTLVQAMGEECINAIKESS